MENEETIVLIEKTLDKIRPFIQRDGGDLVFVKYEEGYVYIKLTGACEGCVAIDQTVGGGIEIILQDEVPDVIGVKLVQ